MERNINVWLPPVYPLLGTWPTTQACALSGNRISDSLVCRLVLNLLSHTSQGWNPYFKSETVQRKLLSYQTHRQCLCREVAYKGVLETAVWGPLGWMKPTRLPVHLADRGE